MNYRKSVPGILLMLLLLSRAATVSAQISLWLTDPDNSILFKNQKASLTFSNAPAITQTNSSSMTNADQIIEVDDSQTYQTMDGFGWCLTGGSAEHIIYMNPSARAALLRELYATDGANIGSSYMRITIGASDLDCQPFSYDDLPPDQTDPELERFSLEPDRAGVIPVLKEILAINPDLKILGSPWSPPPWMKDTNDTRGGSLKPQFYDAYAKYFVKYIKGMKAEGIRIDAITIQNEPLNPKNNPSMLMLAPEQAIFIKNHLGPAFKAAKIDTKIILYDHNCDKPDYPISILDDPEAKKYVDGSAFHLYRGTIDALTKVHEAHPDKNLYFTEQWVGGPANFRRDVGWNIDNLIIGATRNWSRNVIEWNLAADQNYEPHTDRGGCTHCLGAVTIQGGTVTRNPGYYIIAHASKFVRPGSVRIASNNLETLSNVAFKTPDGKKALVVLNSSQSPQTFYIRYHGKQATASLNGGAVGTYVWQ